MLNAISENKYSILLGIFINFTYICNRFHKSKVGVLFRERLNSRSFTNQKIIVDIQDYSPVYQIINLSIFLLALPLRECERKISTQIFSIWKVEVT